MTEQEQYYKEKRQLEQLRELAVDAVCMLYTDNERAKRLSIIDFILLYKNDRE